MSSRSKVIGAVLLVAALTACGSAGVRSGAAPTSAPPVSARPAPVVSAPATAPTTALAPVPAPTTTTTPLSGAVLTVGDGVMFDLEPALIAALAPRPVQPSAFFGSAITRPEQLDWATAWKQQLDRLRPSVVVVLTGVWDARVVTVGDRDLFPGAADWRSWYTSVLNRAVDLLTSRGAHVVWITPLTTADPTQSSRLAAVSDVIATVAGRRPAVTVIDGDLVLTGASHRFAVIDGRRVPLRKADGEHLCPAGALRLAQAVRAAAAPFLGPLGSDDWMLGPWSGDRRYDTPVGACATPPADTVEPATTVSP
jgi:hypothetical protein